MSDSGYSSAARSTSSSSSLPSRSLLFGEIDTTSREALRCKYSLCLKSCALVTDQPQALRSNNSICNLILSSSSTFIRFWLVENIRDRLLATLDPEDLLTLRLVCHDFSQRLAPRLFRKLRVPFRCTTFTKPSRVAALERIGPHVRTLEFVLPRTQETVLPPLVNPDGEEQTVRYQPSPSSKAPASANFGSDETAELLIRQYPPLFHSATNIPSFVRALNALPYLSHICVSCPSYEFPYGARNVVDYALMSLRVAIERAKLLYLSSLSFSPIYPEGLLHMQPMLGGGANPGSSRRWAQIRSMSIDMQADEYEPGTCSRKDQLKTLHNYLRNFASSLTRFRFRWQGAKGPAPMSIDTEPGVFTPNPDQTDSTKRPKQTAIKFTALSHVDVENAIVDAAQISAFIGQHRRTLEEFKFESIRLRSGNWDEALSPVTKMQRARPQTQHEEAMEVPLMFSPTDPSPISLAPEDPDGDIINQRSRRTSGFHKWLTRARTSKAKEQLREGSEHIKHLLRQSLPRR